MNGYQKDLAQTYVGVADDRRHTVFPLLLEDTHWSLRAMTRQLHASGLQLTTITEVADRSCAAGCPWMILEAHARLRPTGGESRSRPVEIGTGRP